MAVAPNEKQDQERKRSRRNRAIAWTVGIGIVLVGLTIWGMHFTSQPNFCGNCHQIQPLVTSWSTGPHKGVACLDCHANPGTVGYVIRKIQGLEEVYRQATHQVPTVLVARVNTQNCIICHSGARKDYAQAKNITLNTGPQAPRVSHNEILSKNLSCLICHRYTAHQYKDQTPTNKVSAKPQGR